MAKWREGMKNERRRSHVQQNKRPWAMATFVLCHKKLSPRSDNIVNRYNIGQEKCYKLSSSKIQATYSPNILSCFLSPLVSKFLRCKRESGANHRPESCMLFRWTKKVPMASRHPEEISLDLLR